MRTAAKGFLFCLAVMAISAVSIGTWEWYRKSGKSDEPKKVVVPSKEESTTSMHSLPKSEELAAFEKFEQDFNRNYKSEESRMQHFEIFVENYRMINAYNAKQSSVVLAVNDFADVHPTEFAKNKLGLSKPSEEQKRMRNFKSLGTFKASGVEVPSSVDWREKGAVTPVKNQGQCGSCWSFSTTGALEGRWQILTGDLCSMSEQQFVDCDTEHDHGCNGGLMDYAFEFAKSHALCSEESFPYHAKDEKCPADIESTCKVCVPAGGVTGFQDVTPNDEDAMKEALAAGPVSVAIEADQSVFQFYKEGVVTSKECGSQLDHGVLAVGYGTYTKEGEDGEGVDYWLVKNSWGAAWGQEGYVRIARAMTESPTGGKVSECGILSQPSFPVMKKVEQKAENPFQQVQFI